MQVVRLDLPDQLVFNPFGRTEIGFSQIHFDNRPLAGFDHCDMRTDFKRVFGAELLHAL
jgi:hypothetical protein